MTPSPHQATGNHSSMSSYSSDQHKPLSSGDSPTHVALEPDDGMCYDAPSQAAAPAPINEAAAKLALELKQFNDIASNLRNSLTPAATFSERCGQAFDIANDLFANAPTWVCFYRELMGGAGLLHQLFLDNKDFGAFLRTDQHHQIQLMLTALRSRDLPETDPNDPQRMITVRLPKSLHEAMCDEATRLNISVNRLCISRMLQLLDPEMIPETNSKPRGRKPRSRSKGNGTTATAAPSQPAKPEQVSGDREFISTLSRP